MAGSLDRVIPTYRSLRAADPAGTIAQFRSLAQASQFRLLYRLVDETVRPGGRVLDWGSGNGHFSFHLARQGAEVTAYAFDQEPLILEALAPAERARVRFVRGTEGDSPVALPFPDASFDAVFSIGVLEHVRELGGTEEDSLREIRRVLRPGGAFVCYHFPNRYSWIEALSRRVHGPLDPTMRIPWQYHAYRFTRADIEALCAAAGFELQALHRYGALPRNVLGRLPGRLRDAPAVARLVDAADAVLETLLRPVTQNYAFVAR